MGENNVLRFLFVCLALAAGVQTATSGAIEDCNQPQDVERKLKGCTQFIAERSSHTKENVARAYNMRGSVYNDKREYDRPSPTTPRPSRRSPWAYSAAMRTACGFWNNRWRTMSMCPRRS